MTTNDASFKQNLQLEFLKALHDEKTKTQAERATYITSKFAFITGLFGLGALKIGEVSFGWLLYFVPLVAVGYDLYIRAADLSIKKIGAFLRTQPPEKVSDSEIRWEAFSAHYRDKLAHLATTLFTTFIIISAAVFIFFQEPNNLGEPFLAIFAGWLIASLVLNLALWRSHRVQIRKVDGFESQAALTEAPDTRAGLSGPSGTEEPSH